MGRWRGRRALVGLLAVTAVLATGCSRGEVSAGDLQESVRTGLEQQGVELRSVSCPSGISAQLDATVICEVELWDEDAFGEPVDRVRVEVIAVDGQQVRYRLTPLAVGVADDAPATSEP